MSGSSEVNLYRGTPRQTRSNIIDCLFAGVSPVTLYWSPKFFLEIPKETRKTVLMHEIWHIAKLHQMRQGNRDHHQSNIACDHAINIMLTDEGYTWEGAEWRVEDRKYVGWVEEDT